MTLLHPKLSSTRALSTTHLAISTTVVLLVACSGHQERRSTDTSSDSMVSPRAQAAVGPARYVRSCPVIPPDPPVARAVFDLHLRMLSGDAFTPDSGTQSIEGAGGRVLHRFHVNAIRAELDTASVRELVYGRNSIAEAAEQVLDLRSLDISVQVRYNRPAETMDSARIARLGGVAHLMSLPRPTLNAVVPDSIVPALLRMPNVVSVRARSVACGHLSGKGKPRAGE